TTSATRSNRSARFQLSTGRTVVVAPSGPETRFGIPHLRGVGAHTAAETVPSSGARGRGNRHRSCDHGDMAVDVAPVPQPLGPEGPGHHEEHTSHRAPRLRAAVLGANDGLLSTSSLL